MQPFGAGNRELFLGVSSLLLGIYIYGYGGREKFSDPFCWLNSVIKFIHLKFAQNFVLKLFLEDVIRYNTEIE